MGHRATVAAAENEGGGNERGKRSEFGDRPRAGDPGAELNAAHVDQGRDGDRSRSHVVGKLRVRFGIDPQ